VLSPVRPPQGTPVDDPTVIRLEQSGELMADALVTAIDPVSGGTIASLKRGGSVEAVGSENHEPLKEPAGGGIKILDPVARAVGIGGIDGEVVDPGGGMSVLHRHGRSERRANRLHEDPGVTPVVEARAQRIALTQRGTYIVSQSPKGPMPQPVSTFVAWARTVVAARREAHLLERRHVDAPAGSDRSLDYSVVTAGSEARTTLSNHRSIAPMRYGRPSAEGMGQLMTLS
jgi:hypothetical protein